MRFHHLTVTAFGPFAETETVDFDELNDAGVFLLSGPTGAGKTSVLDALCFSLYGVVPGERGVKALRSHHAAPSTRPEVVLEATLAGRRFRIRRSPEWLRVKLRGTGETKEQASASLLEIAADGTETLISSRAAEVGHELRHLIGMSSEQFMQVVLLPQGQFQTFLQASSDERQGVLERLFHTQRFTQIESWLRDRCSELRVSADRGEREVSSVMATLAHRSRTAVPDELADIRLRSGAADDARRWAGGLVAQAGRARDDATGRAAAVARAARDAEDRERLATALHAAQERAARARATLAGLEASQEESRVAERRLAAHHRAATLVPSLELCEEAVGRREGLRRDVAAALKDAATDCRAAGLAEPGTEPELALDSARFTQRVEERIADLRALAPRVDALRLARTEVAAAEAARDEAAASLALLTAEAQSLPRQRAETSLELEHQRLIASGLDAAREALLGARRRAEATETLPDAREEQDRLVACHRAARDRAAHAREAHLDVIERRLAGMAAELASSLREGCACQVCGATEHPSPALPVPGAATVVDQQGAEAEAARLRAESESLEAACATAAQIVTRLESLTGGRTADSAARELSRAVGAVRSAEAAALRVPALVEENERLAAADRDYSARHQEASARLTWSQAQAATAQAALEAVAEEVASGLDLAGPGGDHGSDPLGLVEELVTCAEAARASVGRAADLAAELDHTEADSHRLLRRVEELARQAGFEDSAEAAAAVLPREEVAHLTEALEERGEARRAAEAVLAESGSSDAEGPAAPDLLALRADLETSRTAAVQAAGDRRSAEETAAALADLAARLDTALLAWEPARHRHEVADDMARLVRGTSGDNQLQMRLSSYVLATRLDQVLGAANERLSHMQDQRYSLRRTERAVGRARAGLGLEVVDDWTGESRDPRTLSGGETFVVSLALALGLADVVTHEAGGRGVDTLFVDEGFGMLDPETLDDVMDRIDGLRAGGRVVGVVSHVTELRDRIPTQVLVTKGRQGSSICVRTLVA